MSWHTTDALGSVREVAGEPRAVEGIAVPYGIVSAQTDLGREVFLPGSFSASVEHWMGRTDGARMAFRPAHKMAPVGTVRELRDTPEGVWFKAVIRDTPAGNDYLADVRDGLNGISIEAGLPPDSKRMRDGTVAHREAKLHAIAGSIVPAYDGARIALRDLEEFMAGETPTPQPPEPTPTPTPEPPAPTPPTEPAERDAASRAVVPMSSAERSAAESQDATVQQLQRSTVRVIRAESVYSGGHAGGSFLRDGYLAWQGDSEARERTSRHQAHLTDVSVQIERAGEVLSTEIPGAYPNDYMPGLITTRILKARPMGSFYNRIPITDATPKIFPKVTTSTTVAVQSAEGVNPAASDFATTAASVTPLLYGAETVVSRQVLDGASPAALDMIYQDMLEAYAQASETVIKTAVEAGATASGTAITLATPYAGLIGNLVAYQAARFAPATGQFIPPALYATALQQADSTGRSLLAQINSTNAMGRAGTGGGSLLEAALILSWASTAAVVVTGNPSDYVIFESSTSRFQYDAVTGPAAVRVGLWAYLAVGVRLGSLKVTAA